MQMLIQNVMFIFIWMCFNNNAHFVHFAIWQSEMQQWVVGENIFTKDTGNLLTEAGRFRASLAYTSQSQLTNFVLPSNMQQVLNSNVKKKPSNSSAMEEDCYQAHMLTFRTNPYIYSKNRKRQVPFFLLIRFSYKPIGLFLLDGIMEMLVCMLLVVWQMHNEQLLME